MNILNGINNFLRMIDENWTSIVVCVGLCIMLARKIMDYVNKSNDEKVAVAKDIIKNTMLSRVSDAERDYAEWKQAGAAKRAQVIANIYNDYPILTKVIDQNALITWIDETIDASLGFMREMIENVE